MNKVKCSICGSNEIEVKTLEYGFLCNNCEFKRLSKEDNVYSSGAKMNEYKLYDVYGIEYIYNCESLADAKECFKIETGGENE